MTSTDVDWLIDMVCSEIPEARLSGTFINGVHYFWIELSRDSCKTISGETQLTPLLAWQSAYNYLFEGEGPL